MTLKHISFGDSTVMRELERQAVKKNTFPVASVTEIVKQARKSGTVNKYASSNNLYNDLFVLVGGLKELGFSKESTTLADKILICKQAEVHLYRALDEDGEDLVNQAHPDGDAHVADAQEQQGIVETTVSSHKKMVEMVNKMPTGKIAQILTTVDRHLTKAAQEAELPEEITLDEAQTQKVTEINSYLAENWHNISNNLIFANSQASAEFNASYLLAANDTDRYLAFFAAKTGQSLAELTTFINQYKALYGNAGYNVAVIVSKLGNLDRGSMFAFVSKLDPSVARSYFSGVNWKAGMPTDLYTQHIQEKPEDFYNANSVFSATFTSLGDTSWGMTHDVTVNQKTLLFACEKIHEMMGNKYNALIANKLADANQSVSTDIANLLAPLQTITETEKTGTAPKVTTSTGSIIVTLINYNQIIEQYLISGEKGKALNAIFDNLTPTGLQNTGSFFSRIMEAKKATQTILAYLSQPEHAITQQDLVPSKDTYATIINNFKVAARRLNAYVSKLRDGGADEKSKDFNKYLNRLRRAATVYKLSNSAINKPYSSISGQITKIFPKVTSADLLLQESESWIKGTANLEPKAASKNSGLAKQADYGDDEGKSVTPAPNTTSSSGKPATLAGSEKDSVQGMQLALFTLGQYLNTYGSNKLPELGAQISGLAMELVRTGKGLKDKATKNQFDGAWGTNTSAALTAAQNLITAWNAKHSPAISGSLQAGPMMNQGPRASTAANTNTSIINQITRIIFGSQTGTEETVGGDTTEVDGLPQKANLTSSLSPDLAIHEGSNVKLKLADLKNLNTFYAFLTSSGLESSEKSGDSESSIGYEGFSIGKWNTILQWFKKRAVFKYNLFGKNQQGMEGYRQNAKTYYDSVINMESQFKYLFSSLIRGVKDKQNFGTYVVPESLIAQLGQRAGSSGNASSTMNSGGEPGEVARGRQGRSGRVSTTSGGEYAGWSGGGQEGRSVTTPPVMETEGSPIGERLSLERLGILDDTVVYPIITFNQFRANAIDLANSLMNETQAGTPAVNEFQKFLVRLYRAIQTAAAEWSRNGEATEEEIEASSKWSNAWAQVIRKKLDQIKRWRTAGSPT